MHSPVSTRLYLSFCTDCKPVHCSYPFYIYDSITWNVFLHININNIVWSGCIKKKIPYFFFDRLNWQETRWGGEGDGIDLGAGREGKVIEHLIISSLIRGQEVTLNSIDHCAIRLYYFFLIWGYQEEVSRSIHSPSTILSTDILGRLAFLEDLSVGQREFLTLLPLVVMELKSILIGGSTSGSGTGTSPSFFSPPGKWQLQIRNWNKRKVWTMLFSLSRNTWFQLRVCAY